MGNFKGQLRDVISKLTFSLQKTSDVDSTGLHRALHSQTEGRVSGILASVGEEHSLKKFRVYAGKHRDATVCIKSPSYRLK